MKAMHRLAILGKIPAYVRFISVEPLLEPVVFPDLTGFHWMIVGGDSGFKNPKSIFHYRRCETAWLENAVKQGRSAGLAVFVKQLGTDLKYRLKLRGRHGGDVKGDMTDWPESLRIREFPDGKRRVLGCDKSDHESLVGGDI
jgi:protein gp37